jgi:hypothetical protein
MGLVVAMSIDSVCQNTRLIYTLEDLKPHPLSKGEDFKKDINREWTGWLGWVVGLVVVTTER